jgi:hypothetical protein
MEGRLWATWDPSFDSLMVIQGSNNSIRLLVLDII